MNKSNIQYTIKNIQLTQRAFTLVELMIVVAVLGILAAIALPEFQGHIQQSKEAAAKDNLRILREAIERYEVKYGVPPGYPNNDPTRVPLSVAFPYHLTNNKEFLSEMPNNPFNQLSNIKPIDNITPFPLSAVGGTFGWVYKPATKTIKLNWPGTDSKGQSFFDY